MILRNILMASAALGMAAAQPLGAQAQRGAPRLAQAMAGVEACLAMARENGWPVAIVVKDAGDRTVAAVRTDGASLGTMEGAEQKASSSARTQAPTSVFADLAFDAETGAPTAMAFTPVFALYPGGVPIRSAGGMFAGAVGVSGAAPADDVACAEAAVAAILSNWED